MVRPNNSSKEGGRDASQEAPQSPQQPLPQQLKSYNTLAPPLTARSSSEQQRQSERASLLRRLSSGSGTSGGGLLSRHRSADDHPLLHSPYTPVADYKTLAMEMAYLTPRRKIPSVRLTGSPAYRGLFSGAGGAADSHHHHHHHPLQPSPVFPHATSSPSVASAARAGAEEAAPLHPGAAASPATATGAPQQPGFFRAGSADSVAASLRSPGMIGAKDGPGVLTLALFAASILFLFADQNLLAPNLTAVARDFGFDDAQRDIKLGGQIPFAFFVVGGVVSVVVGPLADVMNRKHLYVLTCLTGTIPCLLTYWVRTFEQFFLLRTLTGVAVGGAFPLIYSLASDITTPEQRALASSMITISMGMGGTLGQGVAGFIGPAYGWRLPFVVIAIPSILVIALVMLTMQEPPRAATLHPHHHGLYPGAAGTGVILAEEALTEVDDEDADDDHEEEQGPSLARNGCSIQLRKFMDVFVIRTNLLAFCQSLPGCLPWGVISAFLTDFLHEQRGMTVAGATALMFVFGLGCFAGNLAGGILGQWAYNRSREGAALLMAATTAVGFVPMAWLINANTAAISTSTGGFTLVAGVMAFSGGIAAFTGPLVRAFVMQVNTSRNRGTVFSVFMVADDLGKGLGPAIVSLLIPSLGRVAAFNLSLGGWFVCAFFLFLMMFTITADEEAAARAQQQHQAELLLARLQPVVKPPPSQFQRKQVKQEGNYVDASTVV